MRTYGSELAIALRLTAVIMVVTGLVYPLAVTGVAQALFHHQANGSLITVNGRLAGSSLIGQQFTSDRYFHGRPSATLDANGTPQPYNADNSSASNLGPTNPALIAAVQARANAVRCLEGLAPGPAPVVPAAATPAPSPTACAPVSQPRASVPVDAVTSSGSGLDPDISVAYAELQVPRIARVRRLSSGRVEQLVQSSTIQRQFGVLGEPRVNVLDLNRALDRLAGG